MHNNQDIEGFMRLPEVLRIIPVSKTAWWEGIRNGRYPVGIKLSRRTTAWRVTDIRKLCEELGGE
jgi:predicted DNA-binding transcriptional regulator AlpA